MFRLRTLCVFLCLVLLGACSGSNFVYNRLDFILPWYVDDYADLDSEQGDYLDELLVPFLDWHRRQELPAYIELIDGIEGRLETSLTGGDVSGIFDEFEGAWLRIEDRGLDWLLDLAGQLTNEQIDQFMEVLWDQQAEYEEEYLERPDQEFYEESYDNLVDNAKDYLGSLTPEQRDGLRTASIRLLRSDAAWLEERAEWLQQLEKLLQRKPGWQQAIKDAVVARRETLPPDYVRIFENNMGVIFDVTAELLNGRSAKQDAHLKEKLSEFRKDIETLVAEEA